MGVLASRHEFTVNFYREPPSHLEQQQQRCQRTARIQFLLCPVDDDLHVQSLRLRQRALCAGLAPWIGSDRLEERGPFVPGIPQRVPGA